MFRNLIRSKVYLENIFPLLKCVKSYVGQLKGTETSRARCCAVPLVGQLHLRTTPIDAISEITRDCELRRFTSLSSQDVDYRDAGRQSDLSIKQPSTTRCFVMLRISRVRLRVAAVVYEL